MMACVHRIWKLQGKKLTYNSWAVLVSVWGVCSVIQTCSSLEHLSCVISVPLMFTNFVLEQLDEQQLTNPAVVMFVIITKAVTLITNVTTKQSTFQTCWKNVFLTSCVCFYSVCASNEQRHIYIALWWTIKFICNLWNRNFTKDFFQPFQSHLMVFLSAWRFLSCHGDTKFGITWPRCGI